VTQQLASTGGLTFSTIVQALIVEEKFLMIDPMNISCKKYSIAQTEFIACDLVLTPKL
jgi:hypothetical protein